MSCGIRDEIVENDFSEAGNNGRLSRAVRVTKLAVFVNVSLTIFKFAAGVLGGSAAMVADAVHSLSDLLTDFAVILGFQAAEKPEDSTHNYGHGKIETLAAVFVGLMLFAVGFEIFLSGLQKVLSVAGGAELSAPGWIAFAAAVISIFSKEGMYRYTIKCARDLGSNALAANAWHQRSDAFSSVGTALGTGGAILLGGSWAVLDPLAAVVLSFFIFKIAGEIFYKNINELLEASLDPETCCKIEGLIRSTDGVVDCHKLKTRKIGNVVAADVHIEVDCKLNIVEAHDISTRVEKRLRKACGNNGYFSIHVEPFPDSVHGMFHQGTDQ